MSRKNTVMSWPRGRHRLPAGWRRPDYTVAGVVCLLFGLSIGIPSCKAGRSQPTDGAPHLLDFKVSGPGATNLTDDEATELAKQVNDLISREKGSTISEQLVLALRQRAREKGFKTTSEMLIGLRDRLHHPKSWWCTNGRMDASGCFVTQGDCEEFRHHMNALVESGGLLAGCMTQELAFSCSYQQHGYDSLRFSVTPALKNCEHMRSWMRKQRGYSNVSECLGQSPEQGLMEQIASLEKGFR